MVHLILVFEKLLTKLKEELKSCQKELDVSKEILKKLTMEKHLLDQKVQRLERMKSEEVIFCLITTYPFHVLFDNESFISYIGNVYTILCRKVQWKRFTGMNVVS
jgi:hypothetical protein